MLQIGQRVRTSHRLDTPHTSGHAAFSHHLEQADIARALHMGAAAQFAAGADVQHAHGFAIFFAKQHHGAGFLGAVDVHHAGFRGAVGQDFRVHAGFDLADLRVRHGCVVRKVEPGALGIDQRAFLLHMAAQHFAQGLVHEVRDRMVAHGGRAQGHVHLGVHCVTHSQRAGGQHAMMAVHIGLDLERVFHRKAGRTAGQHALVTHLAAAFGVEGRRVQHHHTGLAMLEFGHRGAVEVERHHLGAGLELLVAHEGIARTAVVQCLVHLELAGRAGLGLLAFHGGVEAIGIHRHATLTAHVVGQVEREAVGVVEFESHVTRQPLFTTAQSRVEDLHPVFQRFVEALLFGLQHVGDALGLRRQIGVGIAHQRHQVGHQLVEERGFAAQLVAVADGAAHDAALHVAPTFVAGNDAIGHQKRGGAQVVGNHTQAGAGQVCMAGFTGSGSNQLLEQVDLVVAVHVLQDGGQTLQAHAGVHAGRGQRGDGAVLVHLELHEHVVPDLDEAVTVFFRAARGATGDVIAMVVKDLGARAAGAGVGHHPEVVRFVAAALVVADADHAVGGQADLFRPDVVGFIVLGIHRGQQAFFWQLVNLGQQLPGPLQALALEVVAERPVAQHLEEGVVARGVTHVLQVVVLATRPQTGLHRRGAHIAALVGAQEHVLELHHAAVGEHQCGVVARHQRAGRHHGMATLGKKVQESLADFGHGGHGRRNRLGHDEQALVAETIPANLLF